jgi:group II intron reverse transcriptase/maturase
MTVEGLGEYLREHWQQIREELLEGTYRPAPVRRHELPKPGGGTRILGIPTTLDRLIQQASLQVLQPEWDPTFSELSYGFRPGRSAHQAVDKAREHYQAGYHRVVSLDLEKFFDRVNHDKMMSAVRDRVKDRRVRHLIRRYLQSGMLTGDVYIPRSEGTPQGGPLSPLLANLLLDQLDRDVRYADDVSIYVKSERAGRRVLQSISDYLSRKLKLTLNEGKSRVDKPRHCSLLGFSIGKAGRVFVSDKSIRRLKDRIRELTGRHRGRRVEQIVREVADYLRGWQQYFNYAYSKQKFRELTAWIKRRLRAYLWTQWGRAPDTGNCGNEVSAVTWQGIPASLITARGDSAAAPPWPSPCPLAISSSWDYPCSMSTCNGNALVRDPYAGCCGLIITHKYHV